MSRCREKTTEGDLYEITFTEGNEIKKGVGQIGENTFLQDIPPEGEEVLREKEEVMGSKAPVSGNAAERRKVEHQRKRVRLKRDNGGESSKHNDPPDPKIWRTLKTRNSDAT